MLIAVWSLLVVVLIVGEWRIIRWERIHDRTAEPELWTRRLAWYSEPHGSPKRNSPAPDDADAGHGEG